MAESASDLFDLSGGLTWPRQLRFPDCAAAAGSSKLTRCGPPRPLQASPYRRRCASTASLRQNPPTQKKSRSISAGFGLGIAHIRPNLARTRAIDVVQIWPDSSRAAYILTGSGQIPPESVRFRQNLATCGHAPPTLVRFLSVPIRFGPLSNEFVPTSPKFHRRNGPSRMPERDPLRHAYGSPSRRHLRPCIGGHTLIASSLDASGGGRPSIRAGGRACGRWRAPRPRVRAGALLHASVGRRARARMCGAQGG